MGHLIVVDCEAPFGVGAPSVGDMTEFGAVDVNPLQDGREETFHGVGCSEDTFRRFREWLEPRMPVVFVSDNPAYDFQRINFYFWRHLGQNPFGHSGRRIGDFYAGLVGDSQKTQNWKRLRRTKHDHHPCAEHRLGRRTCTRVFREFFRQPCGLIDDEIAAKRSPDGEPMGAAKKSGSTS